MLRNILIRKNFSKYAFPFESFSYPITGKRMLNNSEDQSSAWNSKSITSSEKRESAI